MSQAVEVAVEKLDEARALSLAAQRASQPLRSVSSDVKNAVLAKLSALLKDPAQVEAVLAANAQDIEAGRQAGLSLALLDRLLLTVDRLRALARA